MTPPATPPQAASAADLERRFDFRSLFEFSAIVNSSTDLTFILGHLLLTVMGKLMAPRGMILLGSESEGFRVQNVRGLGAGLVGTTMMLRDVPRGLVRTAGGGADGGAPWMRTLRMHGLEILIPMTDGPSVVGLLGFSRSAHGRDLSPAQEEYLMSLANIAAASVTRATAYARLNAANLELSRKIQELNTLFELSKELSGVQDQERTAKLLMFSVLGQIGAHKCFLSLVRNGRLALAIDRLDGDLPADLLPWLAALPEPVALDPADGAGGGAARRRLTDLGIRAIVPIRAGSELKGAFGVGGRMNDRPYAKPDLDFLASLGHLAVIALENSRLFREAIEKQKLEDDLLIAKEIQRGLLPAALPAIGGFGISAVNISSRQVGGDYYDVIPLDPGRVVLAIGDVSGKGTPASLLMANLQASIRALVPLGMGLAELTGRVNDLMLRNTTQGRFITFFWGTLEAASGVLTYVNAGHNPPIVVRRSGAVERLESGGLLLGVLPTVRPYEQGSVTLGPGDLLCLYTDGVTEALNSAGAEFGEDRLEELLRASLSRAPAEIGARIVDDVTRWSGAAGQSDDITLLILRRSP